MAKNLFAKLRNVSSSDRIAAYFLVTAMIVVVGWTVCKSILIIFKNIATPPVFTVFREGSEITHHGLPRWGPMPFLLARTQKIDGTITCPPISDLYYADTGVGATRQATLRNLTFPATFRNLTLPTCKNLNIGAVLFNFTMLYPNFRTQAPHGSGQNDFAFSQLPSIDMRFVVERSDGVDLFYAPSNTPPEAFQYPWRNSEKWIQYIGSIGDITPEVGQYVHTELEKRTRPKKGAYFGIELGNHIDDDFLFSLSGYYPKKVPMFTKSGRLGVNFGWRVMLRSSIVMDRLPISAVTQLVSLLASIGGWATICTMIFLTFFKRKYPPTDEQLRSKRLVLFWRKNFERENPPSVIEKRKPQACFENFENSFAAPDDFEACP